MAALDLFPDMPPPPLPPGIDFRCGDVADLLAEVRDARLVLADPPWSYRNTGTEGAACQEYELITDQGIAAHLDAAFDCAAPGARLGCWVTFPKLAEWMEASRAMRWRYITGGAWGKIGRPGVGFHWRGDSEILLVYGKPGPRVRPTEVLSNLHLSERTDHSEKPVGWLRDIVRAWTAPGDLVLSVYSGLFPEGRACALEGRRCVGAEIDRDRYDMARGRLAQWRTA